MSETLSLARPAARSLPGDRPAPQSAEPRIAVLIPCYNEEVAIGSVFLRAKPYVDEVLVVDDASTDRSADVARRAGATVVAHPKNMGYGAAYRTLWDYALKSGADVLVTLDGDGQHDAAAIPLLLAASDATERAIVVGNRLEGRGTLIPLRRNAVRVASFFAGWTCGQPVADSQSGFRVYPLALFDEVVTRRGGFVFETEILIAAAARGWAIREVAVPALPRAGARSHFRPVCDGVVIGTFLAGRVAARWADEARTVAGELLKVFDAARMADRHAAMLQAAAACSDSPARWSAAIGVVAVRRAGARLGAVCSGVQQRGAPAAALATVLTPLALPLLLLQALVGEGAPDVVTPLIDAVYAPRRAAARAPEPLDIDVAADPLTEGRG